MAHSQKRTPFRPAQNRDERFGRDSYSSRDSYGNRDGGNARAGFGASRKAAQPLRFGLVTVCAALEAVLPLTAPADVLLSQFFKQHKEIGSRDRQQIAAAVWQVLRHKRRYGHLAQSLQGNLTQRLALLAWLELALPNPWLSHIEPALVEATRQVLQNDALTEPLLRYSLPDWLLAPLQAQFNDGFDAFAQSCLTSAPLTLRVNTLKASREQAAQSLAEQGIETTSCVYSPLGLQLKTHPNLALSSAFVTGAVEVQDEGSQLLALLTGAKRGQMVADCCAGAGGKTLALGAQMKGLGRLYAMDVSASRLKKLAPRLARSGLSNVMPITLTSETDVHIKRLAGKFDAVLIDAPCSGLGTLRRNPDMKWRQTETDVSELAAKQTRILQSFARLCKAGGALVYATCSVLPDENEAIVQAFLQNNPQFELQNAAQALAKQGVTVTEQSDDFLRLYPHIHGTDGFFAALMVKKAAQLEA